MYDVAVIGSGPGGYVAALRASMRGAKTCCIEKDKLGGACLNVGCIPTKAMLYASGAHWHLQHLDKLGISVGKPQIDAGVFLNRSAAVVKGLRDGVAFLLKKRKVDVVTGRARLTGSRKILVETGNGTEEIEASNIIIATGSRPIRPDFLPWDSGCLMTTDEATTATALPRSVLILGGGVIGCEFATIYSELGIPTTIVEMLDRLVPPLEPDISKAITAALQQRNVNVITGTKIESVTAGKRGITAKVGSDNTVEADTLLVAAGRKANTEDLGLEKLGVQLEDGVIKTDQRCRTNVEGIYAIGDVAETRQYAHLATRMGIIAADNATGHEASDDRTIVPVGVYTHPEVACVGLSEEQARDKHKNVHVVRFNYSASGMARACEQTQGGVKLIADKELGAIYGAVVIGPHATDVIQEITLAMRNELTVEEIANTIHPHPTFVEAIHEAAEAWTGLPLHMII
ncbi:MAG: dihydrolipoyl dehydrogenase [Planctomycetota bacterium]|jgi:dihydrolipoamide dehydrogenase